MKIYGRTRLNDLVYTTIIVMLVMMMGATCTTEVYGAKTYSFTCERGDIDANTDGPNRFTVPELNLTGVCCQYGTPMKKGKAKLSKLSNGSDYAKVAYYWGVKKGYDKKGLNTIERKKLVRMMQYIANPKGTSSLYYVKYGNCKQDIKKARSVTVPDTFVIYKGVPTNKSQNFVVWKNSSPISLTLIKASADPSFSSLGGYSFLGIKYQVYKSDKKTKVGILTCNNNGTTNTLTGLVAGTYYAKEISANGNYGLNSTWLKVTVAEGGKGTFKASDAPLKGKVVINKGSTDSNSINAGYNFEGIVYGIYNNMTEGSTPIETLTLDASGRSNISGNLPVGTKYIREIATNSYYRLSDKWYTVNIISGMITEVPAGTIMDEPVTGTVSIVKRITGGDASDEEFVFELINKSNSSISYRDIRIKGDGVPVELDVLAGEYILRETDSRELMDETGDQDITVKEGEMIKIERVNRLTNPGSLQIRKSTDDGGTKGGFTFEVSGTLRNEDPLTPDRLLEVADPRLTFTDRIDEYEIDDWKVSGSDLDRINSAAREHTTGEFPVAVRTTVRIPAMEESAEDEALEGEDLEGEATEEKTIDIEAHILVRLSEVFWDKENGMYVGKARDKKEAVNTGDGYEVSFSDFEWCGSATTYRDLNTGRDHTILVTNSRGYGVDETTGKEGIDPVFPGEYTVREVMTDDQKARYHEPTVQTLNWDGEGKKTLNFTFKNTARTIPVKLKKSSIDGKVSGILFCLSGKTAFGDSIRRTGTTDADGNIDFGTVARGSYVIEELGWDRNRYANNHKLDGYERPAIAFEVTGEETEDIVLEFKNVPYASMGLTKRDKETGHFLPGAEFSVVNVTDNCLEATFRLIEEDGYPTIQISNNSGGISVHHTGGPPAKATEKAEGEADEEQEDHGSDREWITITGLISGKDYRVIETDGPLGYGVADSAVEFEADHEKDAVVRFEDERSVIGTSAVDSVTGQHVAQADEDVTIIDTVTYENLIPGKEYRLEGVLMDRSDYLVSYDVDDIVPAKDADGKEIRAEVRFKPDKANGLVKVVFRFDGSKLGGNSLIAYEKLFIGDGLVTSHEDPTDEDQTIELPGIRTNALAKRTGMHMDNASRDVVINDMVSYSNLAKGVTYHLSGVLMDKATGKPVIAGGKEVRSEMEFTTENTSGYVTLTFRFDGRGLAGTTAVAFEELKCDGKIVASHKDITDPSQTVDIPRLRTVAERTSKNRIEDTVYYSGLVPGKKYAMCGILVDKETGKELKETMSEMEFIPEKKDGKIVIRFDISAQDLLSKGINDVVAFERCDLVVDKEDNGNPVPVEIASHRDINDEGQMVALSEPIKKTHTGDDMRHIWFACILSMSALAVAAGVLMRRRISGS